MLYFINVSTSFTLSSSPQNRMSLFQTQPLERRHKNKWPACGHSLHSLKLSETGLYLGFSGTLNRNVTLIPV